MIPSGERLIVSDAFVVLLRSSGMRGFPPWRVFLDLCANSREQCSAGSPGGAFTGAHVRGNLCITCSCDHKADVLVCVCGGRGSGGVFVCVYLWLFHSLKCSKYCFKKNKAK